MFHKITFNKRKIGYAAEQEVATLYQKHGFTLLASNFFNHHGKAIGEIDFVALKNKNIHFVEIRAKSGNRYGSAAESLGRLKCRRLLRAAKYFICSFPQFGGYSMQFDLAEVRLSTFDKSVEKITIHSDVIEDD